jgi:hypothetical protein
MIKSSRMRAKLSAYEANDVEGSILHDAYFLKHIG